MSEPTPPLDGPPPDWRWTRYRNLVSFLRNSEWAVALLAVAAIVTPPDAPFGWLLVALLVALPLVRVAWLAQRWARRGDWRFAAAAVALLCIAGVGALAA